MVPSRRNEDRDRADTLATAGTLPTVPCPPAKGDLAPQAHLHGQHMGDTRVNPDLVNSSRELLLVLLPLTPGGGDV